MSGQPIDDNEVRRKFQQFGDVKAVTSSGDRNELSAVYGLLYFQVNRNNSVNDLWNSTT